MLHVVTSVLLFAGWFSLLTPKGQLVAQCYSTIQQLVAAQITRFITKTELTAYKLNDNKGKATSHISTFGPKQLEVNYAKCSRAIQTHC